MACDVETLLSNACDNGFAKAAQDEPLSRGLILQLFYIASGGSETESELYTQACANGFDAVAQDEQMWRGILLQLFCNMGE